MESKTATKQTWIAEGIVGAPVSLERGVRKMAIVYLALFATAAANVLRRLPHAVTESKTETKQTWTAVALVPNAQMEKPVRKMAIVHLGFVPLVYVKQMRTGHFGC
jgi:hypothetical protein